MIRWTAGLIGAAIVVGLILFVPPQGMKAIVVILSVIGLKEFFSLVKRDVLEPLSTLAPLFGGFLVLFLIYIHPGLELMIGIFFFVLALGFCLHLTGSEPATKKFISLSLFILGILYIVLPLSCWGWLMDLEHWRFWLLFLLASTFGADTGGYVFGRWLGKRLLAPNLSPGKTVEGYYGGIIGALLGASLIYWAMHPPIALAWILILAVLNALLGPLGDLSESLLKRAVGAKDSGRFLPGHGGLLDRIDAVLFTGPLVYFCARLMMKYSIIIPNNIPFSSPLSP